MGVAEDLECRGCLEDEETSGHVLMSCPAFSYARMRLLGQPMLLPRDIRDLCPSSLSAYSWNEERELSRERPVEC